MGISMTKEKIVRLFFDNHEFIIHQKGITRCTGIVPHNEYLFPRLIRKARLKNKQHLTFPLAEYST